MNYIQRAGLVSLLGTLWFVTGYFAATAWDPSWGIYGGLANILISLVIIAIITRTEAGYKQFYEGPSEEDGFNLLMFFLWATPVLCVSLGVIWRILNTIAHFLGR